METESANNKRIAKNALLLYFRMFITMAVSLYTSRVILKALGVEDFGIYNVVGGVVTMLTFINTAMGSASQRYITFELGHKNYKQLYTVFCTSVEVHILIAIIIAILSETIGIWFLNTHMEIPSLRLEAANWVYQFSILSCIVSILYVPFNATIIAHEKMSAFAYISIIEVLLKLIIVYMLMLSEIDRLILYSILIFSIQLFIFIIYVTYCICHFPETRFKFIFDNQLFKNMISFASWSLIGNLAIVACTQGLNILLNIFWGPIVNAARAIAAQVQNAIYSFGSNFQTAINPQITKNFATGNIKQMHNLIFVSCKYSFFLLFFLSLPIIIETKEILTIWLGVVPNHSINFLRITLLSAIISSTLNPILIAVQATGKIKRYQMINGSLQLSILPISFIFLNIGAPPESVFIVHLCISIIISMTKLLIAKSLISISIKVFLYRVIFKIILVCIIAPIIPILIYNYLPPNILSFSLVIFICLISTAGFIYTIGTENEEKIFIKNKINNILKSKRKKHSTIF